MTELPATNVTRRATLSPATADGNSPGSGPTGAQTGTAVVPDQAKGTPDVGPTTLAGPALKLAEPSGIHTLPATKRVPDADGVLASLEVRLPSFESASYFAPFQKYDPVPNPGVWPNACNRLQALRVDSFADVVVGGLFALVQLDSGEHLAVLPLVGATTMAWLSAGDTDRPVLRVGTLGTDPVTDELPTVAWARDANPYAACRRVWELALAHPLVDGSTRLREEKQYPEIFTYLGWCSWEEYHRDIDESLLVEVVDALNDANVPVRWVLVDAGHGDIRDRQLLSFEPEPTKFPNGWDPILARRAPDGVSWFGLWLNLGGDWCGVHPEHRLDGLAEHLTPTIEHGLLPKEDLSSSVAFYDAMIGSARRAGFDFVKVDGQTGTLYRNQGAGNPVASTVNNVRALEMACAYHTDGLLNCHNHNQAFVFNTRVSAISRCSEDYKAHDEWRAKAHIHNSFATMPYIGQTVWGDHDEFHSSDEPGRALAVSKALSGGPVCLSDAPADIAAEHVHPLCLSDGRVLRPVAPGAPAPSSLYADPFAEPHPYRAVAPLAHDGAAVAVFNLTEPGKPVAGELTVDDYRAASALTPDPAPWAVPAEGVLVYDWSARRARLLDAPYPFALPTFEVQLFLLTPVQDGWSVVGRPDLYLSPAAVTEVSARPGRLTVRMAEPGSLVIWRADGRPVADAETAARLGVRELSDLGGGLWGYEADDAPLTFVVER